MRITLLAAMFLLAGPALAGGEPPAPDVAALVEAARADPSPANIDALVAVLPEAPPGSGRYIVEGDYGVSRDELVEYLAIPASPAPNGLAHELIVDVDPATGAFLYLVDPADRRLTWRVDAASFRTPDEAATAAALFAAAAADWTAACPECGVAFEEVAAGEADERTFPVRFVDQVRGPVARAFFPQTVGGDRSVDLFPALFSPNLGFDPQGVMRHEIGHILGFRHEQLDTASGCVAHEGGRFEPVSPYTPNSVMHYLCGVGGSFDLTLRPNDIAGFRCLYLSGKPCSSKP